MESTNCGRTSGWEIFAWKKSRFRTEPQEPKRLEPKLVSRSLVAPFASLSVVRAIDLPGAQVVHFILNNFVLGRGVALSFAAVGFRGPQVENCDLNCICHKCLEFPFQLGRQR